MSKNLSRRHLLRLTTATVGGVMALTGSAQARTAEQPGRARASAAAPHTPMLPGELGKDYTPVITPNGWTLPYKIIDGVKVFHLIAEPVKNEFAPGLRCDCWGYNGTTPGPTIEVVE